ncbi:MAG: radical SAM protein, partial [Actinomycetota bacterium]
MGAVRHLYVHVPFCAHRCGYCDFTTVTGHEQRHAAYVDALLAELAERGACLADPLETVYLGGGTPSRLGPDLLGALLDRLPGAQAETTVECNPEDVTDDLARVLAPAAAGCPSARRPSRRSCSRCSSGAPAPTGSARPSG